MNGGLKKSSQFLCDGRSERDGGTLPQLIKGVDESVGEVSEGREVQQGVRRRERRRRSGEGEGSHRGGRGQLTKRRQ